MICDLLSSLLHKSSPVIQRISARRGWISVFGHVPKFNYLGMFPGSELYSDIALGMEMNEFPLEH